MKNNKEIEFPNFNTIEELTQWLPENFPKSPIKETDKKERVPVERKVFVDDFSYLFKYTEGDKE